MGWQDPIGYAFNGAIYCPDCAPDGADPIFEGSETDCPSHCDACEEYVPEALTPDGVRYVLEALSDARNGRGGRVEILDVWADALSSAYALGRGERANLSRYYGWRRRTGGGA